MTHRKCLRVGWAIVEHSTVLITSRSDGFSPNQVHNAQLWPTIFVKTSWAYFSPFHHQVFVRCGELYFSRRTESISHQLTSIYVGGRSGSGEVRLACWQMVSYCRHLHLVHYFLCSPSVSPSTLYCLPFLLSPSSMPLQNTDNTVFPSIPRYDQGVQHNTYEFPECSSLYIRPYCCIVRLTRSVPAHCAHWVIVILASRIGAPPTAAPLQSTLTVS